jgi:membrane associated rhomboid family serine protease
VILYVLSAFAGSLLSRALSAGPSVGAFGAIFGLQGAAIVLFYKYRRELLLRDKRIGVVPLAWAIYSVSSGAVTPYIDNGAHLGGALVAAALHPAVLRRRLPDGHDAGVLGLLGLVALVVGYAVVAWLFL